MLIEVYLFLLAMGFVLAGLSFFMRIIQKELIFIPFLAAGVFAFAAIGSAAVEQPFCGQAYNTSSDWSCHTSVTTDIGMTIFTGGLAAIMLILAIYWALTTVAEYATTGQLPSGQP